MRKRTHPKHIIIEEFVKPLNMVEEDVINKLYNKEKQIEMFAYARNPEAKITTSIAESLAFVFGTSKDFWLNLQKNYDDSKE